MKIKMFELPCMDGRKSFYGKAIVSEWGANRFLKSYNTTVCSITADGKFHRLWDGESKTTMRHINSFLELYNVAGGGVAWWRSLEVEPV